MRLQKVLTKIISSDQVRYIPGDMDIDILVGGNLRTLDDLMTTRKLKIPGYVVQTSKRHFIPYD